MVGTAHGVSWSLGIVPVQEWIAEARRSRDLLAGPAILSWLMARLLGRLRAADAVVVLPKLVDEDLEVYGGTVASVLGQERLAYGIPNRASGSLPLALAEAEGLLRTLDGELVRGWEALGEEVAQSARRSARELWAVIGVHAAQAPCPFQTVWCIQAGEGVDLTALDRLYAGGSERGGSRPMRAAATGMEEPGGNGVVPTQGAGRPLKDAGCRADR